MTEQWGMANMAKQFLVSLKWKMMKHEILGALQFLKHQHFRIFQVQKGTSKCPFSHLFPPKKHFSPSAHQHRCDGTPSTMWSPCWACCWAFPRWSSPSGASRWTKTVAALMIKAEKGEKRRHFRLGDGTLYVYIYI